MPTFGEFETLGEAVAVTEERGHVSQIWQARKAGAAANALYAIKCYTPRARRPKPGEEETLDKDRGLEFLDAVKQLKKAHSEGGQCLAPIHAFGIAPEGAWYVTDFYPGRTLREWITKKGRVDDAALRHLVHSITVGCLALKRSRGFSHGNLKTANVFLVGKPRPLQSRPIVLGDPYPASASQLSSLDEEDRKAVSELLGETVAAQDLRAIGELILQLVEGRSVANAYEYDYPVARSRGWEKLGKDGQYWLDLCNQLLNPQLSLDTLNLEELERRFQPSALAGKLPLIVGVAGAVCVLGICILIVPGLITKRRTNNKIAEASQQEQRYATAIREARAAYGSGDYRTALARAEAALGLKSADADAAKLKEDAEREVGKMEQIQAQEQRYQNALTEGRRAAARGDYSNAVALGEAALGIKPNDADASKLKVDAERAASTQEQNRGQEQRFKTALADGQAAFSRGDYSNALLQAESALGIRPTAAEALKLKKDSEMEAGKQIQKLADDAKFKRLVTTGREAFDKGDYTNAFAQADTALGIKPNEPVATKLKDDAQRALGSLRTRQLQDEQYRSAMTTGRAALANGDFTNALFQAQTALGVKPTDTDAKKLKADAETGAGRQAKLQAEEQRFKKAILEGQDALTKGDYSNAVAQAESALGIKRDDEAARKLKVDAEAAAAQQTKLQAQESRYKNAMQIGQTAFSRGDYTNALAQAESALGNKPGDGDAKKLKDDAERERQRQAQSVAQEARYNAAMAEAKGAFDKNDYTNAMTQSEAALGVKPNDPDAKKLKDAAQAAQGAYTSAVAAARGALSTGNFSQASTQANLALEKKPKDPAAIKLRNDAEQGQNLTSLKDVLNKGEEALGATELRQASNSFAYGVSFAVSKSLGEEAKSKAELRMQYVTYLLDGVNLLATRNYEPAFGKIEEARAIGAKAGMAALAFKPANEIGLQIATNACQKALGDGDSDTVSVWISRARGCPPAGPGFATLFEKQIGTLPPKEFSFHGITFRYVRTRPPWGGKQAFYAAKFEISQDQFKALTRQESSDAPIGSTCGGLDCPVHLDKSRFEAATNFCKALEVLLDSERGNLKLPAPRYKVKLPSLEQYLSISGLSATQYDNAGGIQKDAFAEFQNKGENIGKGDPPLPIWGSSAKGGTNELGLVNVLGNAYEWSEEGQLLGLPHTGSGGVLGRKLVRDGKDGKGEWQSFRPLLMPSAEGTKDTASAQQ